MTPTENREYKVTFTLTKGKNMRSITNFKIDGGVDEWMLNMIIEKLVEELLKRRYSSREIIRVLLRRIFL